MTRIEARVSNQTKRAKSTPAAKGDKPKATEKPTSRHTVAGKAASSDELHPAAVTKRDNLLALLGRREGATVPEMMEASGWQQHSVRGFLAGTVKTRLGLALTSKKTAGEPRRYRIDSKRGRQL